MLKLSWLPDLTTTDPGSEDYAAGRDLLKIVDGGDLQEFPRPRSFVAPGDGLSGTVQSWIGEQGDRPVTLMVHGFDFDPRDDRPAADAGDNPYAILYAPPSASNNARMSWLPIVGLCDDEGREGNGAAIAFAWLSEGSLTQWAGAGWNSMYLFPAFDLAPLAAQALAAVIAALQAAGKPFNILAHSLGTRVVCQAIGYLRFSSYQWKSGSLKRIVLLDGAEYLVDADKNLLGDGLGFEVFNIVNRQDLVLGWLAHAGSHPVRMHGSDAGRVIGYEGLKKTTAWLDIQIDRDDVQDWIQTHAGIRLAAKAPASDNQIHPLATWNHWICYMDGVGAADGGNRALLRRLLDLGQPGLGWFDDNGFPALEGGRYVDEFYYGDFNPAVPPTPMTVMERQAQQQSDPVSP